MDDNELGAEQEKIIMEENNLRQRSEVVWKEAKPVMDDWENRLTSYEEKHRTQIGKSLDNIAHLFGKEAPEKTKVDLHYLAREDSSKGEPASGLVNAMRLPEGDTDVFYWIGKFSRLPNDGPEQIEEEERLHTTKVIHEVIHQDFQGENEVFKRVLEEANNDQEILQMRKELMQNQADYLEPEAEIIAIYLEQYASKLLKEESVEGDIATDEPTIEYRIDEKRFHEIFKAVVKEDESWKADGPYTAARRGWGVPDVREQPPKNIKEVSIPSEPTIYKLGEKITDFSLIEKYTLENKQLDLNFIKELYKIYLAQRNSENPNNESESVERIIGKVATKLHDAWREPRRINGTDKFEPRIKGTKDEVWVATHGGKGEVDIANTTYEDLPDDWKSENKKSAEVAVIEIATAEKNGIPLDDKFIESASEVQHIQWLERNKNWAPQEQQKPYAQLSEDEKEKDRVVIRTAMDVYRPSIK